MKKSLLMILSVLIFTSISACTTENTNDIEKELESTGDQQTSIDTIETTGTLVYFNNTTPTGFTETALHRTCFIPAQLDKTNDGDMFCFTNTNEAAKEIKLYIEEECKSTVREMTITIKNLTTKVQSIMKSDPCFTTGTCQFNEAEFIQVIEFLGEGRCGSTG